MGPGSWDVVRVSALARRHGASGGGWGIAGNQALLSNARRALPPGTGPQKRLQEDGEVHLAALGSALNTLVTVTEMMKNRHLAVEVSVRTSLETLRDETR